MTTLISVVIEMIFYYLLIFCFICIPVLLCQSAVTWLCFSPNSEQIITASKDGTIRIWNINGMKSFLTSLLSFGLHSVNFVNRVKLNFELNENASISERFHCALHSDAIVINYYSLGLC